MSLSRDQLRQALAATLAELRQTVAGLTVEQWCWKPSPEVWSIGEGAEHLVAVERGILRRLRLVTGEGLEKTVGKDNLSQRLLNRSRKLSAPERLIPQGLYDSPAACLAALDAVRAATLAWVDDPATRFEAHVMPHPAFGELHGGQWVEMIAGHVGRHVAQMREVMTAPGYPR